MKTAIVLFNLGGPDGQGAVRPFLFNLFHDPAIIGLPQPFRWLLATLISTLRNKKAKAIYRAMGGGSPILPNTQAQADALESMLNTNGDNEFKCFIAMRYTRPRAVDVARAVAGWTPDRILLLPLYPQFSTTTTGSSAKEWQRLWAQEWPQIWHDYAKDARLTLPVQTLCCYPTDGGFSAALADGIRPLLRAAKANGRRPRLLLSAHGLPEKIVAAGDPYQWQCEQSAQAVITQLVGEDFDLILCYQSQVGPLAWIGPSTEGEVRRAGADRIPLVVAPLAFVSDHSETLVELDIEYRELAHAVGVPSYARAPVVGTHPLFIQGLADLARRTLAQDKTIASESGGRICPNQFCNCAQG